jgi:hypothetical protein
LLFYSLDRSGKAVITPCDTVVKYIIQKKSRYLHVKQVNNLNMKKLFLMLVTFAVPVLLYSQTNNVYQKGYNAVENLKAIANLKPYTDGAMGFDNRYEGVKGSPRLFDTLLPSFLKIKNQDYYIQVESDIDLVRNSLIFIHPTSRKMMAIPSDIVDEVVLTRNKSDLVFRVSTGMTFGKELKEMKFYQVLTDKTVPLIKMPVKTFTEADYKSLYGPDRRFDEYETKYRYYLLGADGAFHLIQLNARSIAKIYPEKKKMIDDAFRDKSTGDIEKKIISLVEKF